MLARLRARYERALEWLVIALVVALAAEVLLGVAFRALGRSLVWYDEIAGVLLAWVTFYGSALAALKGAHIGFPGLVAALPVRLRVSAVILAESLVVVFFVTLAVVGTRVLEVLATDHLVSLPTVPVAWVQSCVPIASVLLLAGELLGLPGRIARARQGDRGAATDLAEKLH